MRSLTALRLLRCALLAVPLLATLAGCASVDRPVAAASPQDQLRIAKLRYDHRDYTEAIAQLTQFIQYNQQSPDLDEAHFLLGMSHVGRKEWPLAATEFMVVTTDFTDSPRVADAHYWLGLSYWRQSRPAVYDQDATRRSIAQWQRFLNLFPDHPKASEARQHMADGRARLAEKSLKNGQLYIKLKQYGPALVYFDEVIKDYADTPWLEWALVGRAEALRGLRRYDEARTALEEARPQLKDGRTKSKADEILKKLPPGPSSVVPPAADGTPG